MKLLVIYFQVLGLNIALLPKHENDLFVVQPHTNDKVGRWHACISHVIAMAEFEG